MPNMMKLMKQAQKLQQEMGRLQEELAERDVEFTAGGGAVKVVATGGGMLRSIELDPEAIDPEDRDGLQDLILAGVNGALDAARAMMKEEMGKLTGGLGVPGFPG
jgi:DNA-binding YbaB/EbfC family protein